MSLTLLEKIDSCYLTQSGSLLPSPADLADRYRWLHEQAPYSVLAQGMGNDPHFIYANRFALDCFGYSEAEMLVLPSQLCVEISLRSARQQFLESVSQQGIANNYAGIRVKKNGQTFPIYGGVVWQLRHPDGAAWGMASLFWREEHQRPDWFKPD
ncbi:MEKHLA domain-containing protein [Pectobacterium carotovorum]|uniref:MEKHLA domain-containing protein n=1 Tax=Pectobacterium carotovorum TaxID=554 RepID=UPI0015FFE658|nr:MEKHLA domain-containing protein [Pectobacterium carotovorum]MBB1527025.1 MEKHLA domain-containing protein [Pectobacterium carotovorum subsp. carotovorum]MCA6965544.1 MEKHLA domain-containing protein [Pectobacterium carotovorum]MCH4987966.1 MEKHLA domain-containing protein [Pectobacterium carotovorum]